MPRDWLPSVEANLRFFFSLSTFVACFLRVLGLHVSLVLKSYLTIFLRVIPFPLLRDSSVMPYLML